MRKLIIAIFCLLTCTAQAALRINEVMQCNINGVMDDLNEYADGWVELFNDGAEPLNLNGYAIGEKRDKEKAYVLPSVSVAPNSYLLVYCDKENAGLHTDFRLDTDAPSTLYLWTSDGTVADSVSLPTMLAPNTPYGRIKEGWSFLRKPTPLGKNGTDKVTAVLDAPTFSIRGGVLTEPTMLKLSLPQGAPADACIMYTLDGSTPREDNGKLYLQPIPLTQTVAVRAKCFSKKMASAPTATHTYIFLNRQPTLPIVSLVTDDANFFDPLIGIYTRGVYAEKHPEAKPVLTVLGKGNYFFKWNRPVNIEYFTQENREAVVNQMCETRIGGNSSRRMPLKALVLMANKHFGKKNFAYPFFADKPWQEKNKSITLRTSSQDAKSTYLRDAFAHQSFKHTGLDYQAYQPAIFFYNGEYWGLRNLRERTNDDYIWANQNKLEDFDLVEGFYGSLKDGDLDDFNRFKATYSNEQSTYEQLDALMDINEFLDYFVLYSLYCNTDFPGNNVLMWKPKQQGAKWRWIAKDFDVSMGMVDSPYNLRYLNYITRTEPFLNRGDFNNEQSCQLFKKLLSFPNFRDAYIDRAAVYMGTFASADSLSSLLDSLAANIEYEMPFFAEKRGYSEELWEASLINVKEWLKRRVPFFYSDLSSFFQLGKDVPLLIDAGGKAYFNNYKLANGKFNGRYFEKRAITLCNDSAAGYVDEPSKAYAFSVRRIDETWRERDLYAADGLDDADWVAQYVKGDSLYTECYAGETLRWSIPTGAASVRLAKRACGTTVIDNSDLTFVACDFSGRVVAQGKYGDVMQVLANNKTYILYSYRNGVEVRKWKVRKI